MSCICGKNGFPLYATSCPIHGVIDRRADDVGSVWVVFAQEHDHSGGPEFLAAYDGPNAEASAVALAGIIKRAGCYRDVVPARVPLWPLLRTPE